MKLVVVGFGQCGGRLADEFARLNKRARSQRGIEIVTGAFAVNTDAADLSGLKTIRPDYQHRILIGGRRTGGHGVGKINELGAEVAKEDGDKVVDALRTAQRFFETDEGFVDTWFLPPGQASGRLMFSYSLPYDPSGYDLVRDISYPLKALNVLVAEVGVAVTSDQLTLEGSRGMQGQSYLNLSGQNLSKGERLTLHFSGSPGDKLLEGREAMPAQPSQASNQSLLRWAVLGLVVLAVGFALGYPLLRRQPKEAED